MTPKSTTVEKNHVKVYWISPEASSWVQKVAEPEVGMPYTGDLFDSGDVFDEDETSGLEKSELSGESASGSKPWYDEHLALEATACQKAEWLLDISGFIQVPDLHRAHQVAVQIKEGTLTWPQRQAVECAWNEGKESIFISEDGQTLTRQSSWPSDILTLPEKPARPLKKASRSC